MEFTFMSEGKAYLRENWVKGCHCPLCNHWVKINPYPFHYSMARVLIYMYHARLNGQCDKEGYMHVEDYLVKIGSTIKGVHGKMKYWELVEDAPNEDSTKKRSGMWRITEKGKLFVENKITIPSRAFVYLDECKKFSSKQISIVEALGKKFDYSELMGYPATLF